MLLILTHENADFDAVASQWAAYKLNPEGIPLLSWRINRNVEQFLNLYWDAFNFRRPEDWQRQRVDRVLLVDTLALPSVRGVRPDRVEVHVIDHHLVDEDRRESWHYRTEAVGATTTLLVEMLQAAGLRLSSHEATLLLLGIHEDTGSFNYDTTTNRDIRAGAWLLEEGAQLSVLRRFLNIPLSVEQQALFEQLQDSLEWLKIEGQTVILAAVNAPEGFEDEISAVAHRLRDALAPDGMFLLVQLKYDHVQLVARSGTDQVDVGVVARALGGGGHSRAAAATVMDRGMDEVKSQIIDLLPHAIKPMVKVSQIMSHGVQTVLATTTVAEAAEQMQRFGHEGYPVVHPENKRLIGLLTRRMVDRAMSHKLGDLPVRQIMKAGVVTVRPSESVEQVQRLMIKEGWGQIPVISDNAAGESAQNLIGIVTRTDLLNLLTNDNRQAEEIDMRRIMVKSLSEALWGMVQVVGRVASDMEMPLYFVGGLVRDLLLGKPPKDIDLVVEGDAIELVWRLRELYGGEVRSHAQFGTAKWLMTRRTWRKVAPEVKYGGVPDAIDFVTARQEFYTQPSALPEVEQGSIKLDLHRRDFTINTLAVRLDGAHLGELLDFYNGRRDIEMRLIRVLHSLSFVDDPTRILRAARLEQRLDFRLEGRTAELIGDALPMLKRVTGDRIRNELEMCLLEARRIAILSRLDRLGVLKQIHPEFKWHPEVAEHFDRAESLIADKLWAEVVPEKSAAFVYFALLILPHPTSIQQELMDRLRVRKTTRDDVLAAGSLLTDLTRLEKTIKPSHIVFTLKPYPARAILVALAITGTDKELGKSITKYQSDWRHVRTDLNGNDLLEQGLEPGPYVGWLLEELLSARLDGLVADRAGEQALLDRLLAERDSS